MTKDFMRSIAVVVREYVDRTLAPITERLATIESRPIVCGLDGKDGEPGPQGPAGQDGSAGLNGQDGTSVTIDDVAPMITSEVVRAVLALPLPKDGQDGASVSIEAIRSVVAEEVDSAVKALPAPLQGPPGRDAEVPVELLQRLDQFERQQAEQVSTADVLAAFTNLIRKEFQPLPGMQKVVKRVLRDQDGRISGIEERHV